MKTSLKTCLFGSTLIAAGLSAPAAAQPVLYDLDGGDQSAFDAAVANKPLCDTWTDFSRDADYGIAGFGGPVTSTGAGPVSAGTVAPWMILRSGGAYQGSGNDMVAIGPSAGFGNAQNSVGSNYFVDYTVMDFTTDVLKCAVQFNIQTLLGGVPVDITVTDVYGNSTTFFGVAAGATGHNYGIAGADLASISFRDPNGADVELLQGQVYAWAVPAPGAVALLSLGGLAATRRRR